MKKIFMSALVFALAQAASAATFVLEHEVKVPRDRESLWLFADTARVQVQANLVGSFEQESLDQLNVSVGPKAKLGGFGVAKFPMGLRLDPDDWSVTHVITKANFFGRYGDWRIVFVNDLSWGLDGRKDEHFTRASGVWRPDSHRVGVGPRYDAVVVGDDPVVVNLGLALDLVGRSKPWYLGLFPHYDIKGAEVGLKVFGGWRFGK